ncbi:uncharacterized protein N7477_000956 [Penicillium maclennaniae]|uniref:uncharacterized protein n=1 Tax=Penicillium maclennaniae TaxID=1343394 RepID=UPI00253F6D91|nr:uncharacterized protein N7477_000956 [Penicillium maclennaniae]KAJ5684611.1 hypothetical protein N7477_000956 [Penicillium maclennaniae]
MVVETNHYLAEIPNTSNIVVLITPAILRKTFSIIRKTVKARAKSSAMSRNGPANACERL